jgi:flap endonuclease-1
MGIHLLNRFLRSKNPPGIQELHLKNFTGKKIAIDISIYLYRYASQDALTKNILKMCEIFKLYKIRPLFVFDGKSNRKKDETLKKRKQQKRIAYNKYIELKKNNNNMNFITKNKSRLLCELKRKSTFINIEMINKIKNLLDSLGNTYITAEGEADELCAALAKTKRVDAVLSEDTDMFAYGVPVVLKYFSFVKHTIVKYDISIILQNLNLNYEEFLDICVLSGTDYNKSYGNLFDIYNNMIEYKKLPENDISFDMWVSNNKIITGNITEVMESKQYYKINEMRILKKYPFIVIKHGRTF